MVRKISALLKISDAEMCPVHSSGKQVVRMLSNWNLVRRGKSLLPHVFSLQAFSSAPDWAVVEWWKMGYVAMRDYQHLHLYMNIELRSALYMESDQLQLLLPRRNNYSFSVKVPLLDLVRRFMRGFAPQLAQWLVSDHSSFPLFSYLIDWSIGKCPGQPWTCCPR